MKPEGKTDQITEGNPDQKHTEGFKLLPKSNNKAAKALDRRKTPSRPRRGIASPVAIRRGEGAQRKRCSPNKYFEVSL